MKSLISFIACLTLLLSFNAWSGEFKETSALNNKVSLVVPAAFKPMSQEAISVKYLHSRRPTEVISDDTHGVSIAFNHTQNPMEPEQLDEAQRVMSKVFHNLYPSAEWIREGLISQNGSKFLVFEMITPAMDTKIHNIMYGTSVDGRFLLVAFNTTVEQSEEWLPIGKKVMESIEVNH